MNRRFTTLTLTALACAVVASAQTSSTSGAVRGVIKDKGGKVLASVTVSLRNRETGLTRTTSSNAQGEYQIGLLPVGNYELTVTAPGLRTVRDANVQVLLGQNVGVNFSLDRAEASATVEVASTSETLDTTQVNSVVAIDERLVENVPLKGRNFADLMKLTPGAVTGATGRQVVEGSRGIMNNLTIDGASFNSGFYGDPRGGTAIPFAFGLDTVKEMQIITDAYDPQYAGAGAVINAVSKQGGNEFSGDVLDQFRSQSLVAKLRPVPYDPRGTTNTDKSRTLAFSQQQLSANVGGAIIKDKLFYFVGAEQVHYSQSLTPAFAVASSGGNSAANLNTYISNFGGIAVGGGQTLASESGLPITNDQKNLTFFGRLDWNINENHRASLRLNTQQFTNTNGTNLGVTTGLSDNGVDKVSSISWVAELISSFGANLTNEARLQVADERHPRVANSSIPELTIGGGFTSGQIWYAPSQLNEFNNQVLDTLTWAAGDWQVKGGVDLQWFSYQNQFPQYMGGFYSFPDYATANRWAAGTLAVTDTSVKYQGAVSPTNGWINYNSALFAGFLQAQYHGFLNKRLTLTGGIRVTRENEPNNPLPASQFAGTDQANSSTSYDPRFGFSLDLFGDGKTVLKGGWGAFTSPDPSLTVSNTMTANGNTISVYSITPATALAAWNSGSLSYANRTLGGTTLLPLDTATLTTTGGLGVRTGQLWDPNNKMPRKIASTLGLEHKYDNGLVLGARGEYSVFQHQQYFINVNLGQLNADGTLATGAYYNDGYPTNVNLFSKVAANRPGFAIIRGRNVNFNGFGNVYLSENNGTGSYKAMTFTAARTSDTGFGFQSSVTFSKAMDMNSNERITNGGVSVTNNPADPGANLAPSDSDARFRGVFTGYFPVLYGVQGAVTFQYQSGLPYSALAGGTLGDLNGDGLTSDYAPGYGGRNGQRQPSQKFFDLAFKRTWAVTKKFQIEGGVQIFNLFNWANQTTGQAQATNVTGTYPTALVSAPVASFGFIDTLDRNPREVQFSLRFKF